MSVTTPELVKRVRCAERLCGPDMDKLIVIFVVLGGHFDMAELKYQHNKVRRERWIYTRK